MSLKISIVGRILNNGMSCIALMCLGFSIYKMSIQGVLLSILLLIMVICFLKIRKDI